MVNTGTSEDVIPQSYVITHHNPSYLHNTDAAVSSKPTTLLVQDESASKLISTNGLAYLYSRFGALNLAGMFLGIVTNIYVSARKEYPGSGWVEFVAFSAFPFTIFLLLVLCFIWEVCKPKPSLIVPMMFFTGIYCAMFASACVVSAVSGGDGNTTAIVSAVLTFLAAQLYGVNTLAQKQFLECEM